MVAFLRAEPGEAASADKLEAGGASLSESSVSVRSQMMFIKDGCIETMRSPFRSTNRWKAEERAEAIEASS